jgi:hypothetical protein
MANVSVKLDANKEIMKLKRDLARDGLRVLQEAYHTAEFESRTGNLFDSFGCAVYYNGVLQEDTISTLNPTATEPREWYKQTMYGRDRVLEYLRSYRPKSKGLSLIVVAAMPYYEILEKGQGYLTRKYKVITGANSIMREIAKKYEGKFGGRRKQGVASIRLSNIENE